MTTTRIWYGDGTIYDGEPEFAPTENCQIIIQPIEEERLGFVRQRDFYWWEPEYGMWSGGDQAGLWDYVFRTVGWQKILCGRTLPSDEYNRLYQEAKAYRDAMR